MALLACALWLCGIEVLPAFHQGMHDRLASHRHDVGSIITVSFDVGHRHADGTVHGVDDVADHGRRYRLPGTPAPDNSLLARDGDHRADGLAHRSAALAPVAPPVNRPLPVDRRPILVDAVHAIELVACDPLAATARGPPGAA